MDAEKGSWHGKAIIAGSGFGVLAAAIALRHAGHEVHIYETEDIEKSGSEVVHICPNANSILSQLGVDHESAGGSELEKISYHSALGGCLGEIDVKADARRWQKPWLLTTRSSLLRHLEEVARSRDLSGIPVQLHSNSIVSAIKPDGRSILLKDGTTRTADLVVCTSRVNTNASQDGAGNFHNSVDILAELGDREANEARVLVSKDTAGLLNIFGDKASLSLSGADLQDKDIRDALAGFREASPGAMDAISKAAHEGSAARKTAQNGRSALPPNAFQIAADPDPKVPAVHRVSMSIESGASFGVFLSSLSAKGEVPERVDLFNETRRKRAVQLQEQAKAAWGHLCEGVLDTSDLEDAFGHDAMHHATHVLRQHIWDKAARVSWRQPVGFGPMTSPRQHVDGWRCANPRAERLGDATSLTASIRFRTSATLLRNLFPSEAYSFVEKDSVAEASYIFQGIENLAWLGGGGYNLVLFQVHGIRHHSQRTGTTREGAYVAVVLEDLTDPILSGREDLGWPKLYSEIETTDDATSGFSVKLSWRGTEWLSLHWKGLTAYSADATASPERAPSPPEQVFVHKYIPATVETPARKAADADYDVLMPPPSPTALAVVWTQASSEASIRVPPPSETALPTLWHIAARLAELPVLEIVEAKIGFKQGQDDFIGATRV